MARPPPDEVEDTLWRMVCESRRREDDMRKELRDKVEQLRKEEQNLEDWEHYLNVQERRIKVSDEHLSQLMKDLHLKNDKIDSQIDEICQLKRDIDEGICKAREEREGELKVSVLCRLFMCSYLFII